MAEAPPWYPEYPPYDVPYLAHFADRFAAAFIALHPFVQFPGRTARAPDDYPTDEAIVQRGTPLTWETVCRDVGFESVSRLNRALLTTIAALQTPHMAIEDAERILGYLETGLVWPPFEGQIQPLHYTPLLETIRGEGHNSWILRDEFGTEHVERPLPARAAAPHEVARAAEVGFHVTSISAPDDSLLAIVDWDSFFTVILAGDAVIDRLEVAARFEGFRCSTGTTHLWWWTGPPSPPAGQSVP